jgi:hypothetical protein
MDTADVEHMLSTMDRIRLRIDSGISDDQIARWKDLDAKHRAYYWRGKKTRGPKPSHSETQEYQNSLPVRLRALQPAMSRVFLAELDSDEERQHSAIFETFYADIHTYQYAWIGMIMKNLEHKQEALHAIRSILVFASTLILERYQSQKALCVLRLGERAVDELQDTMSEETGEDRFDLSIQEYKVSSYISMALAELGRMEESILYFREAAFYEQHHRFQGMMEYQHQFMHDEDFIKDLDNTISVLHVISETVDIPRLHLDESFHLDHLDDENEDSFFTVLDHLEDPKIWRCIQSLGFGLEDCNQEPIDCCSHCWTKHISGNKKKFCSRCKAVFYCNEECQRMDWKYHKEDCIPVQHSAGP